MTVKIGINGFGRIGRLVTRIAHTYPDVEVVAINSTTAAPQLAHLLKYDSNYGIFAADVSVSGENIMVDDKVITVSTERDPSKVNWSARDVDIVLESTGKFRDRESASAHLKAGAKKVIISAAGKNVDYTVVYGVNEAGYQPEKHDIISNASCTTNCLAPVVKVLDEQFGVVRGLMTTVHAYTKDQNIVDGTHKKDWRRARSAGLSMIPTTTGAVKAVGKVLPQVQGKLTGLAIRVPTPTSSIVDLNVELNQDVTVETVNNAFIAAAQGSLKGILGASDEPLVSVDYKGDPRSAVVDLLSTQVIENNMVKVLAWYDNEWGYSQRMVDLAAYIGKKGL